MRALRVCARALGRGRPLTHTRSRTDARTHAHTHECTHAFMHTDAHARTQEDAALLTAIANAIKKLPATGVGGGSIGRVAYPGWAVLTRLVPGRSDQDLLRRWKTLCAHVKRLTQAAMQASSAQPGATSDVVHDVCRDVCHDDAGGTHVLQGVDSGGGGRAAACHEMIATALRPVPGGCQAVSQAGSHASPARSVFGCEGAVPGASLLRDLRGGEGGRGEGEEGGWMGEEKEQRAHQVSACVASACVASACGASGADAVTGSGGSTEGARQARWPLPAIPATLLLRATSAAPEPPYPSGPLFSSCMRVCVSLFCYPLLY